MQRKMDPMRMEIPHARANTREPKSHEGTLQRERYF
jgi:hypothetical protein